MRLPLPNVTLLLIDTGEDHSEAKHALEWCQNQCIFYAVKLITRQEAPQVTNYKEFNHWMISDLYKHFDSDFVLIVQQDGYIVNTSAWSDEFLKYDFIGSPLDFDNYKNENYNGGFSLRSKKLCEEVAKIYNRLSPNKNFYEGCISKNFDGIETIKDLSNFGEDCFICWMQRHELEKVGIKIAPVEVAEKFSWEWTPKRKKYNGSFGFHGWHPLIKPHTNQHKNNPHSCAACYLQMYQRRQNLHNELKQINKFLDER